MTTQSMSRKQPNSPKIAGLARLTVGDLRKMIDQIGNGHDNKSVAVLRLNGGPVYLAHVVAVQGDRLLFEECTTPT